VGTYEIDPAFAELCRREHVRLVGLLALYTGDRAVAEDLAQEVLLRLHQHWPRVRLMGSPHLAVERGDKPGPVVVATPLRRAAGLPAPRCHAIERVGPRAV
jgi:hypothetical protein